MYKPALLAGAIFSGLSVVLGAFAAHALKEVLTPDRLEIFEKGVTYQTTHGMALLAAGMLYPSFPNGLIRSAGYFFIAGIILFSGSLYLLSGWEAYPRFFPLLTPLGGTCFIAGWLLLIAGILKKKSV